MARKSEWDDIGSGNPFGKTQKKIMKQYLKGKVIIEETKNCYLRSEERLIVGINLNNLVVVETNDAILVADKDSTQKVKKVVEDLKKRNFTEGIENKKNYRPWGNFISIEKGSTWQVKKLEIKPKASISLQMHKYRSEHWVLLMEQPK